MSDVRMKDKTKQTNKNKTQATLSLDFQRRPQWSRRCSRVSVQVKGQPPPPRRRRRRRRGSAPPLSRGEEVLSVLPVLLPQTYCSLGKVYAATPGGGEDSPCTEGYLKTAVVCVGGEKVFLEPAAPPVLLLLLVTVVACEW